MERIIIVQALEQARSFISGFEDDDTQEGITELLQEIDKALEELENN